MKTTEAAKYIIRAGGAVIQWGNKRDDGAYNKLVKQGFCELDGAFFKATEATLLAMLTPKQFLCAQQLAKNGEIGFNEVPKAQNAHMKKLVEAGLAWETVNKVVFDNGKLSKRWVPTPKLVEAVDCWLKAKGETR